MQNGDILMEWLSYLNEGKGDPCAGQLKAMLFEATSSKATRLSLDENFGLALPTGSKLKVKIHTVTISSSLNSWDGRMF